MIGAGVLLLLIAVVTGLIGRTLWANVKRQICLPE
jgi:hypothetical protein